MVVHLERPGPEARTITLRRGALAWTTVTSPDMLERDDRPVGSLAADDDGVAVRLDAPLTALRLSGTGE